MGNIISYKELELLREEISAKLDKIVFENSMEDISETLKDIENKLSSLVNIDLDSITTKLDFLNNLDEDKLNELVNLLKDYNSEKETDNILEEKVNQILIESGVIDRLKDELLEKIDEVKNDILSSIRYPLLLKDLELTDNGVIKFDIPVIDVLEFQAPIYKYEDGNIVIYCYVVPEFKDGKLYLDVDEETKDRLNMGDTLKGFYTSIRVLVGNNN